MGHSKYDKLIFNGIERYCSDINESLFLDGESLYEVIRVINGIPIFLDDHLLRLENSVDSSGCNLLMDRKELISALRQLIMLNQISEGNIKLSFNYGGEEEYSLLYFIETYYPDEAAYRDGVHTIMYNAERESPEIKKYNYDLRSVIQRELLKSNAYEAILLNNENCITEGSKSNIFFIKGDKAISAPSNAVLPGITRKYIIRLCNDIGLSLEYKSMTLKDIEGIDAVFISGTSPKVLPVKSVGELIFDVNNTHLRLLMSAFDRLLEDHIKMQGAS
jgi:branched-chain amino acid aminotransferase